MTFDRKKAWEVECGLMGYVHLIMAGTSIPGNFPRVGIPTLCGVRIFSSKWGCFWGTERPGRFALRFTRNPCPRCYVDAYARSFSPRDLSLSRAER